MGKRRPRSDTPPKWIEKVIVGIQNCVRELDPVGSFGVRLLAPVKEQPVWSLLMFPLSNELYGGRHDGSHVPPGFSLCLTKLMQLFDAPPHVDWVTPGSFSGELDGPHIAVDGTYRNHPIAVSIFDQAPAAERIALRVNQLNGEITYKDHAKHS